MSFSIARPAALAAAAVLATALLPMGAAAASAQPFGYAPVGLASAHGSQWASSSPWGGYVATGSGFTSIVGSWVEPKVTCNSDNNLFAPWVGIDGYGSNTVEQTGAQVSCASGSPAYSAWYEMYPKAPVYLSTSTYPVSANDKFTGSVTTSGNGSYKITLKDTTKGWTYTTTKSLDGENVSAEAIIESPSQSYPTFTAVKFSAITVNGEVFSDFDPTPLSSGGYSPTALNGGAFSLKP
jgi:hypothetical protein